MKSGARNRPPEKGASAPEALSLQGYARRDPHETHDLDQPKHYVYTEGEHVSRTPHDVVVARQVAVWTCDHGWLRSANGLYRGGLSRRYVTSKPATIPDTHEVAWNPSTEAMWANPHGPFPGRMSNFARSWSQSYPQSGRWCGGATPNASKCPSLDNSPSRGSSPGNSDRGYAFIKSFIYNRLKCVEVRASCRRGAFPGPSNRVSCLPSSCGRACWKAVVNRSLTALR